MFPVLYTADKSYYYSDLWFSVTPSWQFNNDVYRLQVNIVMAGCTYFWLYRVDDNNAPRYIFSVVTESLDVSEIVKILLLYFIENEGLRFLICKWE